MGICHCRNSSEKKEKNQDVSAAAVPEAIRALKPDPNTTPSSYDNINLDALASIIDGILQKAKQPSCSERNPSQGKWKLRESSAVAELGEFLCLSGECADQLRSMLAQGSAIAMSMKNEMLEVGKVHWAALGLLVVGLVLERVSVMTSNQDECLDLLDEMFRLCNYLKDIRNIQSLQQQMGDLIQKSTELIVDAAIVCSGHLESSNLSRMCRASVTEKRLEDLRERLNKMHTHLMLKMSIYNAKNAYRRGVRLPRKKFYPCNAVGIDKAVADVTEMLEFDSDNGVVVVIVCGVAGIGKTTLADAVYSSVDREDFKFSKVCLFESSRVNPNITEVQKSIIDDISVVRGEVEKPSYATEGQSILQEILKEKSCLLYIDNVLSCQELRKLLPRNLWESRKLRLLVTARESNVCQGLPLGNPHGFKVFQVPFLDHENSMAVLTALLGHDPASDCITSEQLEYILKICRGVPLALETVANYICQEEDKSQAFSTIMEEHERNGSETLDLFYILSQENSRR